MDQERAFNAAQILNLHKEIEEREEKINELTNELTPYVNEAHKIYHERIYELEKKYPQEVPTFYEHRIKSSEPDHFKIVSAGENGMEVEFEYNDRDGENFFWNLYIPYTPQKLAEHLTQYMKDYEIELEGKKRERLAKAQAAIQAKMQSLQKELDSLKSI
jgi:hypothetical protein